MKDETSNDHESIHPPSFAQSEFETIIRRQKNNPHGLKIMNIPSRYPTLDNDWEFAVSPSGMTRLASYFSTNE
jgi:hypothetical protein